MTSKTCQGCARWITAEVTDYGNGERITNWAAPDGVGRCENFTQPDRPFLTPPAFGCTEHKPGDVHVVRHRKLGAPWQHSRAGPCPDCQGLGGAWTASVVDGAPTISGRGCNRCAGTGKVRHYDDGHVGEERTRLHPKEKPVPIICKGCSKEMLAHWVACPYCGGKLEPPAEVEDLGEGNAGEVPRRRKA